MKIKKPILSKNLAALVLLVILGLTIYVLLPQLQSFRTSFQTIKSADKTLLLVALMFFSLTYFLAAETIQLLANFKLHYRSTLLIQVADGFTNKLVPAGIGGVTTNFLYLKKQSKSDIKAGYIAVLNNLIGFAAHMLLLVTLLFASNQLGGRTVKLHLPNFGPDWLVATGILICLIVIFWWQFHRPKFKGSNSVRTVVSQSLTHPFKLLGALSTSVLITLLYSFSLFMVMLALNVHLPFLQAFLVFTVSVGAQAVVPTPGGIGGVEASLVASQMALGVASGPALSVALAFRFITYWLPILPGVVGLEAAYKQRLIIRRP